MKYFAYGSNMLSGRIRAANRAPNAKVLGPACLAGYRLVFNKMGKNGTGKANVEAFEGEVVWGVVFELTENEFGMLDRREGKGYSKRTVSVLLCSEFVEAVAYVAVPSAIDNSLKPAVSYLKFVVDGANEHSLPADYRKLLAGIESVADPAEKELK